MKCTVIFQPHLFTRTRDLADGFAAVLDMADEVMLLPIYPARELPIEGVNSEMIASLMEKATVNVLSKEEVISKLKTRQTELLITAGAGDIDTMLNEIKTVITAGNRSS
jgi:UDP-N-acetylmuramate--alanine ligase